MKHINRLLQTARRAKQGQGRYIIGFVEYVPEKKVYTAAGTIYGGAFEKETEKFYSEHDTPQEAKAALAEIEKKYPDAEKVTFIIDDLTYPEGVGI